MPINRLDKLYIARAEIRVCLIYADKRVDREWLKTLKLRNSFVHTTFIAKSDRKAIPINGIRDDNV